MLHEREEAPCVGPCNGICWDQRPAQSSPSPEQPAHVTMYVVDAASQVLSAAHLLHVAACDFSSMDDYSSFSVEKCGAGSTGVQQVPHSFTSTRQRLVRGGGGARNFCKVDTIFVSCPENDWCAAAADEHPCRRTPPHFRPV